MSGHFSAATMSDVVPAQSRMLDGKERRHLEASFDRDLGHVRVHEGAHAAAAARSLDAAAFTVGHDVVLGAGVPAFSTPTGRYLLAHEVAHTLQQRPVAGSTPVEIGARATPHEHAADGAARRVAAGGPAHLPATPAISPVVQRAELGTYVSTHGEKPYLDGAVGFFNFWGHTNVKRVASMEEIVEDLASKRGHVDTFRIVSHGNAGELKLGLLKGLPNNRFSKDEAALRTAAEFRPLASGVRIMDDATYESWTKFLLADPKTKPLLAAAGVTTVPDGGSVAGLFLRGLLESQFVAIAQGPDGKPANVKNRGVVDQFTRLRQTGYARALAGGDAALKRSLDQLVKETPGALARAGVTVSSDAVEDSADPLLDRSGAARLDPTLARDTSEGAGGPYVSNLEKLRARIDDKTQIEIRGCNVGADGAFLDLVRSLFGRPGKLPSVSAPDLYQYFFQIETITSYRRDPGGQKELTKDFGKFSRPFETRQRMLDREAIHAVNEKSLAEFATKYGLDPLTIYLLNPELRKDEPWHQFKPPLVWLVARKVKAGANKTFAEFATNVLGDASLADVIKFYNPQIAKQTLWDKTAGRTELEPNDDVWLSPPAVRKGTIWDRAIDPTLPRGGPDQPAPLRTRTASPSPTAADYDASLRGGRPFVFFADEKVKVRLDAVTGRSAIAAWLAARNYGAMPVTTAKVDRMLDSKTIPYVEFLAEGFPPLDVDDPLFNDDPRYPAHIIRRP